MKFLTVHIVNTLPLHNMNRDQSGLPKSQFDGGIQRGRLSAQALKRAARVDFLDRAQVASTRTREGVTVALDYAKDYAGKNNLAFDEKAGRAAIKKVVDGLAKASKEKAEKEDKNASDDAADGDSDNVLFFSKAELEALGIAAVEKQADGSDLTRSDFILDARSASLDVAAFGRMFAADHEVGTQAAIAVSHAATTHPFHLTADYFSAVDDWQIEHGDHAGAAHIGMTYYTSGTYYRTFTVDVAQLRRSWSRIDADGARDEVAALIRALITALPTGRLANSNAHTLPSLVLVEQQRSRVAYDFDEPIVADGNGYKAPTLAALAQKRRDALAFDANNFGGAFVLGATTEDFNAEKVDGIDALVAQVADLIFATDAAAR